jgi:general secretion pathway protein G
MHKRNTVKRPAPRGFTLIELIVVMAIVALLVSIAAPRYFRSVDRARENTLRTSLNVMRNAIDQHAADRGQYPDSLAALADARYLREVPEDPMTGRRDSWIVLPAPPGSSLTGSVFDVVSGASSPASDQRLYADW